MIQGFREPPGKIISTDRKCTVNKFCNFCGIIDGRKDMFACNGCHEELPLDVFRFVDWYIIKRNRDSQTEQ